MKSRMQTRRSIFFCVLLWVIFTAGVQAKQESELAAGLVNPGYHDKPAWFKESFLDLNDDVAEAAAHNRRVLLYFYQDGCPYCKKLLEDNFGQRSIAAKTRNYFDVIAINIWGDREITVGAETFSEKQFAEALKVQYTPTLLFFNEANKVIFRANGYYPPEKFNRVLDYVGQKQETRLRYQDYAQQHPYPQQASGKLHTGLSNVRDSSNMQASLAPGKHLLVMFEQAVCAQCDELYTDIMQRESSVAQLQRLNVAVVDMWSQDTITTTLSARMSVREWVNQLDINYAPSLVYFNDKGEEVFRTDAYLKAFHMQSVMDYVASGAYKQQPNFQRYIDERADNLRGQGVEVNLMD